MSSPASPAPRTRRRPSGARDEILEAVEALLLEGGAERVSIRRVSEQCGYTAPTIYHHFGDKAGLIGAVLEERFREVLEIMRAIPMGPDPAHTLREMARAFLRFAIDNPDHYRLLAVAQSGPAGAVASADAARELVKRALGELARDGSLGTSDTDAAFHVTWALLHGLLSLHVANPEYGLTDERVEMALDMVEAGLLRREVRER